MIAVDVKTEQSLSPYQRLLRDILDINHHTDMGTRYGFVDILTLSEYQENVPVTGYDVYEPLVKLQTNIGESGIITSDAVKNYMFIPGSMSNPRFIPCTDRQLEALTKKMSDFVMGKHTFIMLESIPQRSIFNDNAGVNTAYGSVLSKIFDNADISVYVKRNLFTSPYEVLFPSELVDLTYIRLLFALADRSVNQIIAPNTWEVWETFQFLEKNWNSLCADIESGKAEHFGEATSDDFMAIINSRLKPDPIRASELSMIFENGFDTPVLKKIWKKMSKVVAFGEGSFSIYTAEIGRYLGDVPK